LADDDQNAPVGFVHPLDIRAGWEGRISYYLDPNRVIVVLAFAILL
jgi:hypothetical protein